MVQKTFTAASINFVIKVELNTGTIGGVNGNPYSGSGTHTVTAEVPSYDDYSREGVATTELSAVIAELVDGISARLLDNTVANTFLTGAGFAEPVDPEI